MCQRTIEACSGAYQPALLALARTPRYLLSLTQDVEQHKTVSQQRPGRISGGPPAWLSSQRKRYQRDYFVWVLVPVLVFYKAILYRVLWVNEKPICHCQSHCQIHCHIHIDSVHLTELFILLQLPPKKKTRTLWHVSQKKKKFNKNMSQYLLQGTWIVLDYTGVCDIRAQNSVEVYLLSECRSAKSKKCDVNTLRGIAPSDLCLDKLRLTIKQVECWTVFNRVKDFELTLARNPSISLKRSVTLRLFFLTFVRLSVPSKADLCLCLLWQDWLTRVSEWHMPGI